MHLTAMMIIDFKTSENCISVLNNAQIYGHRTWGTIIRIPVILLCAQTHPGQKFQNRLQSRVLKEIKVI